MNIGLSLSWSPLQTQVRAGDRQRHHGDHLSGPGHVPPSASVRAKRSAGDRDLWGFTPGKCPHGT